MNLISQIRQSVRVAPKRRTLAVAVFVVALVGVLGGWGAFALDRAAAVTPTPAAGYSWPLKPFDQAHPVRANFGDPRMVFHGPPTAGTLYHGPGSFTFHRGVDIYGPLGAKVYPVRDGVVVFLSASHINVRTADGTVFEYWHIAPHLPLGTFVHAGRTVLGAIGRPGHVDLTEVQDGRPVNPLAPGHLTPYADTTHPKVATVRLQSDNAGHTAFPNFVHGSVWLVADVFDKPAIPVPGSWSGLPVTPAVVSWRIQQVNGAVVVPTRVAVDFRANEPANNDFWSVYARGTYQNMTAFHNHYSLLQPGDYLFLLAPAKFDTRSLPDGVYNLVVTATDIRGNTGSGSLRFTIHNGTSL